MNNKLLIGLGAGGIVALTILSVVILFGDQGPLSPGKITEKTQEGRVNLTPYPTIPEVTDTTVMINSRRFNPSVTTIKAGHTVGFLNIDDNAINIQGATQEDGVLNIGAIVPNDVLTITIDTAGTYTYINADDPEQTGTVIVVGN